MPTTLKETTFKTNNGTKDLTLRASTNTAATYVPTYKETSYVTTTSATKKPDYDVISNYSNNDALVRSAVDNTTLRSENASLKHSNNELKQQVEFLKEKVFNENEQRVKFERFYTEHSGSNADSSRKISILEA